MKTRIFFQLLALGFFLVNAKFSQAQTRTAFTYQGNLQQNGAAANGSYDFQFGLYTSAGGGVAATALTNLAVSVTGGLFTTTLDFSNVFDGTPYWLGIAVRPAGGGVFTSLTTRQALTPAPSALYAANAGTVTGVLAGSNLPPNVALLDSIGLNSLAYQSTNRPTFAGGTNQGDFTLVMNTNYGVGVNINLPVQGFLNWYDQNGSVFGIFGNEGHSVEPELQFGSQGSFSFTEGLDARHASMNHFGGSGPYHGFYFMQYDSAPDALDPLGDSHPFGFCYRVWDNNQIVYHYSAFRFESTGTNDGQGNLLYYDHAAKEGAGGFKNFNQELDTYSHVAGGFGMSNFFWGSATFTNGLLRGAGMGLVSGTTYPVDFSLATPGFMHLTFSTNVIFGVTNLGYVNTVITKDLFLDCGYNSSIALAWPTNWLCESRTGADIFPTNLSAGTIMHVRLTAECSAATNIYAEVLLTSSMRQADPDAAQFWTAAGITDNSVRFALNAFVTGLKANGLWTQWDCIYPLVGGTAATCSWNLANPSAYRINWTTGASTFDAGGWTSDGTSSFGNTQFNPSTAPAPKYLQDSATMLTYTRTPNPPNPGYFMGATDGSRAALIDVSPTLFAGDGFNDHNGAGAIAITTQNLAGALCISRTGATTTYIVATGGSGMLTNTGASTGVPVGNIYLGARDSLGLASPIAANFGMFMIGSGITPAQYSTLTNLITTFEATLNRQ